MVAFVPFSTNLSIAYIIHRENIKSGSIYVQFSGLVGKYNSTKLLKKHNEYVEHATVHQETIGVIQKFLFSATLVGFEFGA